MQAQPVSWAIRDNYINAEVLSYTRWVLCRSLSHLFVSCPLDIGEKWFDKKQGSYPSLIVIYKNSPLKDIAKDVRYAPSKNNGARLQVAIGKPLTRTLW
jgi:hypothetical protein